MALRTPRAQVVTDLANAADRSQSKLPDRKSEIGVLRDTLTAKTDQEEKEEKKMLDRDMDDIGEGSARGTVRSRHFWKSFGGENGGDSNHFKALSAGKRVCIRKKKKKTSCVFLGF